MRRLRPLAHQGGGGDWLTANQALQGRLFGGDDGLSGGGNDNADYGDFTDAGILKQ